ncbi:MAG TPA: hypothetical protein VFX22_10355, partial [Candidatus Kapabacteria bacterium]|nr:hypothetical protein [Candidatus Kapabacteria bacterium]
MNSTIISAIIGLVTGAIGSLIAPWSQWLVERHRALLANRKSQLNEWRRAATEYDWEELANTHEYATLRPL